MKEIVVKQLEDLKTELNEHMLWMGENDLEGEDEIIANQDRDTYQYGIDLLVQILRTYKNIKPSNK